MKSNVQFTPRPSHYNKQKIWTNKKIELENVIRQGKVLSGPEFGPLVDEVEVELRAERHGIKHVHLIISSFLFMDDITIASSDIDQMKKYPYSTEICMWQMTFENKLWKGGVLIINSKNNKADN